VCDASEAATRACTGDCWKLAYCVAASGCGTTDTPCIQAACVGPLGGMAKYTAAAQLAIPVDFEMCVPECFSDITTDGGTD
jgi:hypothetical protein